MSWTNMSKNSRMMSYFSRAVTSLWDWIYWSAAMLFRATALVLAIPVLAVYLIPDFLPRRRGPSRSIAPSPPRRKREIPIRDGSDIFVIKQDGTKEPVEALEAATIAKMWADVTTGAFVYEKTRVRLD